jgi:stage V sporulation protein B
MAQGAAPGSPDRAKAAGRGGMAVLGAKVFFLVVGFIQQPLVRMTVGLSDFGALAQAQVISNTVNNVVVSSATQGVSRAVSGAPGYEDQALRVALRVHIPLAIVIAGLMAILTPLYVSFEHAQDVTAPLYVLAAVALLYGLYAPLIGVLNGKNLWSRQALLDITFATLRTIGLIGVGYWFVKHGMSGVLGTTIGWVAAAAIIVPIAVVWAGIGKPLGAGQARPAGIPTEAGYLRVLLPIAGAQLATNVLMQIDTALLGRFLSNAVVASGMTDDAQRDAVKRWVGIYKDCQTFAFLPYQLLFSITLILFPMVARAVAEGDTAAVREYVARGARLAAIFCGLLVGVIVAIPESMLGFAYPSDAAQGADVLRMMVLGQGAFAMLGIATTVLTSVGRERLAALITAGAVVAVGGSCALAVPSATFGHDQLLRSAQAVAGAMAFALVVGGLLVRSATGAFVPPRTAVRTGLAVAVCVAVGLVAPRLGRLVTPVVAACVAAAYLVLLVVIGELGSKDIAMVRAMRGKRGGSARP